MCDNTIFEIIFDAGNVTNDKFSLTFMKAIFYHS